MAEYIKVPAGVYDMVTRCMEQASLHHGDHGFIYPVRKL